MKEVFGAQGFLAGGFAGYEARPQQFRMAEIVQKIFQKGGYLAVEAGTGVGKSFAYLIPAIDAASLGGGQVLISTFTITLQEQLINKDLPFLAKCLPRSFTAVLAKGRGNYLCKRRLAYVLRQGFLLPERFNCELDLIKAWASQTHDGSLSDLGFVPSETVWEKVNSEHGNCQGRKCQYFKECFYQQARRQLDGADIIAANHALMFSDLVLKEEGFSLLPDYKYVIIDEAHNIERVAEDHFGIDVSEAGVKRLLDELYNPRTKKGVLAYKNAEEIIDTVIRARADAKSFFAAVGNWYEQSREETNGRCHKHFITDVLSESVKKLRRQLSSLANSIEDVDEKFELMRFVNKCALLISEADDFLNQQKEGSVYWVEPGAGSRRSIHLRSAAIDVGPDIKRVLFDQYQSVVMTSATLSVDGADGKSGFKFFAGRIGIEDYEAVKLGSPFDYQKQVTMYIEKDMPDPNQPQFIEDAVEKIKKYVLKTDARAFVLFTSYAMMEQVARRIYEWFEDNDIEFYQQGAGTDRSSLLRLFKKGHRAVLFGADSFWQGVDVPGEALSNVIIVRLPFAVPDQPLLAGRLEQIRLEGGNPFFDYQLPCAVIKFKQGFGRLIRTKTDSGIIAVLDSRIINKKYGQMFLNAVPPCKISVES